MEFNNKIGTLNTYDLITKFLNRPNITNHISKHLSSATMKPVDAVFSSVINDSFIILKFQENPKSSQYFKNFKKIQRVPNILNIYHIPIHMIV